MKESPQRVATKLKRIISSEPQLQTLVPFLPVLPAYVLAPFCNILSTQKTERDFYQNQ